MSRVIRIERPDWFVDAACRGEGPGTWFPIRGASTQPARQRCADCPVVRACLEYAIADETLLGIWGGTSEQQRDQIRRRRRV